jgi:hypothetical protein
MELGRRRLLGSLLYGLAALVGGAPARWLAAHAEPLVTPRPLFSPGSRRLLVVFADVIVPEWNGHPSGGSGEFAARFAALAEVTAGRADSYSRFFERFVKEVAVRVPLLPGPPDPGALGLLFERWHQEFRTEPKPSFAAQFFEMLRRDVMRTYYATPAGWRALGYQGPAHRATPDGGHHG